MQYAPHQGSSSYMCITDSQHPLPSAGLLFKRYQLLSSEKCVGGGRSSLMPQQAHTQDVLHPSARYDLLQLGGHRH